MTPRTALVVLATAALGAAAIGAAAIGATPPAGAPPAGAPQVGARGAAAPSGPRAAGALGPLVLPTARSVGPGAGRQVRATRWRWPVAPRPEVLRRFVAPTSSYGPGHRGLDLAAAPGTPVLAVEGGRVTHSGTVAGRGTVTVLHRDGLSSTYEPVLPSVRVGVLVAVGDVLGAVEGAPGGAVTPGAGSHCGVRSCLHLGARRDGGYLDPWPLLTGGGRVRLLPLGATARAVG